MTDRLAPLLSAEVSPDSGRCRRFLVVGVFIVLVTLALVVPPAAVRPAPAGEEWPWEVQPGKDSELLPLVGELTFRDEDSEPLGSVPEVIGVDPELSLAVFASRSELRLVDTGTLEPLDVIELPDGYVVGGVRKAVLDQHNHRVFLPASAEGPAPGEEEGFDCGMEPQIVVATYCNEAPESVPAVVTVSLTGNHPPVGTRLSIEQDPTEEGLETEIVQQLAYHAPTDNVYVLTESGRTGADEATGNRFTTVHEFPAVDLIHGGTSDAAVASWSYRLETCAAASNPFKGGFLARGTTGDFLYLPCEGGVTGMHGAVRVDLVAGDEPSDTSRFEERFSPIAADLSNGYARGDAAHDLIYFVGAAAGAQRLFTFDAHHEAWTGATALTASSNFHLPGTNPQSGRIYVPGVESGMVRVTEGDHIAVPNGVDRDLGIVRLKQGTRLVGFDPGTRRLFIKQPYMCLERDDDGSCTTPEPDETVPHFRVFEDRTPDAPSPEQVDYDQNTEDVAAGDAFTSAGANADAFGARHLWVGGVESASGRHAALRNESIRREVRAYSPLGPSSRDIIRAQVRETTLSRVTATPSVVAAATGLTLGDQSRSDLKKNTDRSWPDEFPEDLRGQEAYCDDFGGDPTEDAKPGAAVSCNSLEPVGRAGALYTATDEQAPVQVGYTETSVEVREDDELGAVAMATAVVRDVDIFEQISIGEIRTEATAVANGRPGTAVTELVREYRQVRVGDGFACGWGADDPCDAWEIASAVNAIAQPRVIARVPAQDTTLNTDASDEPDDRPGKARVSNGTPGGARATVTLDPYDAQSNLTVNQDQRTELPALQIVYYDDHDETSRHIFQFAAVNLDVFYYISSTPKFDPPDWADGGGGDDGLDDGGSGGSDGGLSDDLGGVAARTVTPPPVVALGEEPASPAEEPEVDSGNPAPPTGDADGSEFETDTGSSAPQQGQAPGLGTADGPTVSTGEDVPPPQIAPDESSGEQAVAAQGGQGASSGPGGLMLTRQRMGETVPLAVLWVLTTLPFYLAVRRRRLLASSTR